MSGPEKRRCTTNESERPGFSFDAPRPNPARVGRATATGLAVPKASDRGRSWDGVKSASDPKPRPTGPTAKSASPSVQTRDVKRLASKGEGAAAARDAKAAPKAKVASKAPTRAGCEKLLQAALALRNSKSLRLALARANLAPPGLAAKASGLLARLEQAEQLALERLSGAERREEAPWRLVCLDFDRTIAKEHMWGTYKDAPLDEVPISEETFTDLTLFRWLVRGVRKRGGDVAIASFGRKDVAMKAMCYALGEDHGVTITTPADYADPAPEEGSEAARCPEGSSWFGDKNTQLSALAGRFGVQATDMILLDDDLHNVQEAARAGVAAFHAPAGLNKAVVRKMADSIGLTGQSE